MATVLCSLALVLNEMGGRITDLLCETRRNCNNNGLHNLVTQLRFQQLAVSAICSKKNGIQTA